MKFESFQNNFCKSVLGVRKCTSNIGVKAELGMYPLSITIMQKLLHYYVRLKCMDDYFLAKKALSIQSDMYNNECSNTNLTKRSYLHSVYSTVEFCKCYKFQINKMGTSMSKSSKSNLKKHLEKMYTNLYKNEMDKINEPHNKLRIYNLVKRVYKKELYLDHINSADIRRSVSKFRLSDHSLPIEIGRRQNLPTENRFCKKCNLNKIGDEYHLISECSNSKLITLRENLFLNISTLTPQFKLLSKYDKFLYIFSYSDKSIINPTSIFTHKALKIM